MSKILILICLLISIDVRGEQKENLIYKKDSDFNPITYYFNASFDVMQNPYYFSQNNYFDKHEILFKRITSLNHSVKKDGGWQKLFKDEFLSSRVAPNIGLHLVGSGYDSREIYEYYDELNYKFPMLFTVLTLYAGHIGNEAIELSNENVTSHDHLADLLVYDVLAIFMFRNDSTVKFFKDDLGMRRWDFRPFIDIDDYNINSAGLNYIFRPDIFKSKAKPFLYIGMQNLFGLSYEFEEKTFLTFASGIAFTDPLKKKGYLATGIFYDRDDFLAASVVVNGAEAYKVKLNIYPSIFTGKYKFGITTGVKRNKDFVLGLNYLLPLGVGVIL